MPVFNSHSSLPLATISTVRNQTSLLAVGFRLLSFCNLSHSIRQISRGADQSGSPSDDENTLFGGLSLFLTIWALGLTWTDFALKLLLYIPSPLQDFFQQLHGIVNLIALTLETLVSLLYWPISLYDPSLMIPPPPAIPPPVSLDIALHLFPTLFLWIDYLCFSPTLDTTYANIILVGFALVYTTCIELAATYRNSNKFPYPFLTIARRPVRYLIYAFSAVLCRLIISLATTAHSFL